MTSNHVLVKYQHMIECLTCQQAQDLLRHCVTDGKVIPGPHFRKALADEGVTFQNVFSVLFKGIIYKAPEHDTAHGEWKYSVEGHEPDGKWLVVVFSFKAVDTAFLITVFSIEARNRK